MASTEVEAADRGMIKIQVKGLQKSKLVVMEQSWAVKHNIGNMVSNTVITMYGDRWVVEILRKHFVKYMYD